MRWVILLLIFVIPSFLFAQEVSNIQVTQQKKNVIITYDLSGDDKYEVEIFYTIDDGQTWQGPLIYVSGEVGEDQEAGTNKQISWNVLEEIEELQGFAQFKIKASEQKWIEWVLVEGGIFSMGSNIGEKNEKPVHMVKLSKFNISKFEVTHRQFISFLNAVNCNKSGSFNDAEFGNIKYIDLDVPGCAIVYSDGKFIFKSNRNIPSINCPVICVTWYGASAFSHWVGGRLPTEAEWEFVAHGGNSSENYTYSGSNTLSDIAWFRRNSKLKVHPVGQKKANELGIYDMSGNVWEWCADWFDNYRNGTQSNPLGQVSGSFRVMRGGSFENESKYCKIVNRGGCEPEYGYADNGFRVARSIK